MLKLLELVAQPLTLPFTTVRDIKLRVIDQLLQLYAFTQSSVAEINDTSSIITVIPVTRNISLTRLVCLIMN